MSRKVILSFILVLIAATAEAADHLLYFEAQGIAGYSTAVKRAIFYSMNPDAEMQKPSLGFDFLKRFSGETGDFATVAIQARLAVSEDNPAEKAYDSTENPGKYKLEPQIY